MIGIGGRLVRVKAVLPYVKRVKLRLSDGPVGSSGRRSHMLC